MAGEVAKGYIDMPTNESLQYFLFLLKIITLSVSLGGKVLRQNISIICCIVFQMKKIFIPEKYRQLAAELNDGVSVDSGLSSLDFKSHSEQVMNVKRFL